jgi:hypothetical protein
MEDNINNICKKHVKATSPLCRGSYSIGQRKLDRCAEAATPLVQRKLDRCAEAATPLVQRKLDRCAEAESVESLKQLQQVQSLG